jgi:hypothetical protein
MRIELRLASFFLQGHIGVSSFASERNAVGICDRCGRKFKLKKLKREFKNLSYSGLRVCDDCFDPESSQSIGSNFVVRHAATLENPAIDNALDKSRELESFTIPSFAATYVNRIHSSNSSINFNDYFRTNQIDIAIGGGVSYNKTLLYTSTETIRSKCDALVGPYFRLYILSATLTVGANSVFEKYTNSGSALNGCHLVLKDYDTSTVSWSSFNNGGVAGVDYNAVSSSDGTVGSYYVAWDMKDIVQTWLDSEDKENKGLFFPDMGTHSLDTSTDKDNVIWDITFRRVIDGY